MFQKVRMFFYTCGFIVKFIVVFFKEYNRQKKQMVKEIEDINKKVLENSKKREYNTEHERFYN